MSDGSLFQDLAEALERVRGTGSKNGKVEAVAAYLAKLTPEEAEIAARLATGKVSESGSRDEAQVGYSTLWETLQEISATDEGEISKIYRKHGDLGDVAEALLSKKRETALFPESLTLLGLSKAFEGLRGSKGKGSLAARKGIVKSLLLSASPLEGKYIIKMLTGEMRTGLVQGLMEEAIAKAYSLPKESVAEARMLLGDIGALALAAGKGELASVRMSVFRPVNFMLAEPFGTPAEIWNHFGRTLYAEYKYDGVRAQVHKLRREVRIYSRRLEDVTEFFPEVEEAARGVPHDLVLDGEIVPFRDGRPLPFQLLQRRLRRIKDFSEAAHQAPVTYFVFDAMLLDGKELFRLPLDERSGLLDEALEGTDLSRAERRQVKSEEEVKALFRKSRDLGYEGLVVKDPSSPYTMGRRGTGWGKLKEELDTLDVVIVAAEYGHGKRAGVISDYTFAVRDGPELKTIGKAYSGLTDVEIDQMTSKLKEITVKDFGYRRTVRPQIVLEVAFDSIQRSTRHDSGFALRFPRIKRIREDKSAADADELSKVVKIFDGQRVKLDDK
jgi:DNA ligase 1